MIPKRVTPVPMTATMICAVSLMESVYHMAELSQVL